MWGQIKMKKGKEMNVIITLKKFDKKYENKLNEFLLGLFGKSNYKIQLITDERLKKHGENLEIY